jgi:hypothetical protein
MGDRAARVGAPTSGLAAIEPAAAGLDEPWYRTKLPCLVGKVDLHLIDVAPSPTLGRVIALNDRVVRLLEVRSRVTMR